MMRGRWCESRRQGFRATHLNFFEAPSDDPEDLEAWCYTDAISYAPGERVDFHVSTSADTYDLAVIRDGARPTIVYEQKGLAGARHETPADAYRVGCGWPIAHQWTLPADIGSGGYVVRIRARNEAGEEVEQHHFFVVRAIKPTAKILLVCATSTWIAYNAWGGANHYEGVCNGPDDNVFSPVLHLHRPWERGQIWLPKGAPRIPVETEQEIGAAPRYANLEYAYANGFGKYYAAAGWASFERHFVVWAERNGYALDYATQYDLQFHPEILSGYECVAFVGHDEYWSGEMRDAVDAYVDSGGDVARFGGNFLWQVRLEADGLTQVCYKHPATALRPGAAQDPLMETEPTRLTGCWDLPEIDRPAAATFGLSGARGVYCRLGGANPRNAGGFNVFRPQHWVFDGTDLYYGDNFGAGARIFAYETDGVAYTFKNGLPEPTFEDGAPEGLQILALGFASSFEEDHGNDGGYLYAGDGDREIIATAIHGDASPEHVENIQYGAGMMAYFERGKGRVLNAATCEWVNGLRLREPMTEKITKNVLDRFANAGAEPSA